MELLLTLVLLPLGANWYNNRQLAKQFKIMITDSEETRLHKVYHVLSALRAEIIREEAQAERNRRANNPQGVLCHTLRKERHCRELLKGQALAERNGLVYYNEEVR